MRTDYLKRAAARLAAIVAADPDRAVGLFCLACLVALPLVLQVQGGTA